MQREVSKKEIVAYCLALASTSGIYILQNSYLLIFLTDIVGLSALSVGTIFLVARLWDAVNDSCMGIIADRTRTKWGKCRPYLLWMPIPILVITILIFTRFPLSNTQKIIYTSVTYILWGMIFTVLDIPIWSLPSRMTLHRKEKTNILSIGKLCAYGSQYALLVIIPILLVKFGYSSSALREAVAVGGNIAEQALQTAARAFQNTAILLTIIGTIFMFIGFTVVRERVEFSKKEVSIKNNLNVLLKNKPLFSILGFAVAINVAYAMTAALQSYYAINNLGDIRYGSYFGLAGLIGTMSGMFTASFLVNKFERKTLCFVATGVYVTASLIWGIVGYSSPILAIVLFGICIAAFGVDNIVLGALLLDNVDYADWKIGVRGEGMVFATQTFSVKLATSISALSIGTILTAIGYISNTNLTKSTLDGLHYATTIYPCIILGLGMLSIMFYPLDNKKMNEISSDLEKRGV